MDSALQHVHQRVRPAPCFECVTLLCRPIMALIHADNAASTAGHMAEYGFRDFKADTKPL